LPPAKQTLQVLTRVEEAVCLGQRLSMLAEQDSTLKFEELTEDQRQQLHRREYIPALELSMGICPLMIQRHLTDNQTVVNVNPNGLARELCAGDLAEL
jgi:hypothetical protein